MRLAIGADHAGFELKESIARMLRAEGHDLLDLGTHSTAPVDYPDFAAAVSRAVVEGQVERGVLICGSGVGAAVAANKIVGVRAGLCHDTYSAAQRPLPRCSSARSSRHASRVRTAIAAASTRFGRSSPASPTNPPDHVRRNT
jgi:Ribose/Galactose Isomerase